MSDRLLVLLAKLARRGDLVIAILMLFAVVMMLIPLPTMLVDMLITANIAGSVLILLVAFYVSHPLQFSSMPSVILVATLFRLAITITTTRLILLQADAGEIITAFGTFVVGGSLAVGLIIFLIISIAQFIVVAKGAERVAEVAARFTLDALPGKQMSIDAELRSGDIDQAEARRLRQQLERESQLFGAMDGAMKFVKGDVIAGLIIILVNLIGGFAVGMLQHGMGFGEAVSTYSLLSVGDGLVAQLPALLVSVAAGTMVTRVAGADGESDLGRQITGQMLRDPRALALAAAIMLALSVVPGFPMFSFLVLGAAFGVGAYAVHRRGQSSAAPRTDAPAMLAGEPSPALPARDLHTLRAPSRIAVHLGAELAKLIPESEFSQRADGIRRDLFGDLGVDIPAIGLDTDDRLPQRRIRIDLEGAPILDADISVDRALVDDDLAHLDLVGVDHEQLAPAIGRRKETWVDAKHAETLRQAGINVLSPLDIAAKWLAHALRLYAGHFVGIQETRKLLSDMEPEYADLVKEAQEVVPLQKIAELLRRLVAENVPIRNLRLVLEAVIEGGQREQDVVALTEYVRATLKRQISFRVADRNNVIAAYVLQRSAEDLLRATIQRGSGGNLLSVPDDHVHELVGRIEQALDETSAGVVPVVLAAADVRRHMRSLLLQSGIELPVLSYQELASEFNVQPLAAIGIDRAPAGQRPVSLAATPGAGKERAG
jgi:type III secretion protein V